MPELTKLNDCDTEGDYIVVYGDSGTDDPCLSIVGRAAGVSTDVILDRTAGARLVVALDAWLQDTAKDRAEQYERGGPAKPAPTSYPETSPAVFVPDYDAPNETGRALRLSAADGFIFVECGRETTTAVDGDASARTWTVDGSTGVEANALIRALAHLLPLERGLHIGVATA